MKASLLIVFALMSFGSFCQKKKYVLSDDSAKVLLKNIPTKDDKIFYDSVLFTDSSIKKEQLFIKIRQWFVENFTDSKSVLEVNDNENGLLTGKGTYKYATINGLNAHEGYTTFIMNVAVKDGKFRYQLYDFVAEGTNTSLWSTSYNNTMKEKLSMNDALAMYKKGQRQKYASKYLIDMLGLVYYIQQSLGELAKSSTTISDF